MRSTEPRAQVILRVQMNGAEIESQIYQGEIPNMSQEQQDYYKSLIGDGMASVTVSRDMSEMSYGNGGKIFVSVSLTCDQSQAYITTAATAGKMLIDGLIDRFFGEMRQELVTRGIIKPPQP